MQIDEIRRGATGIDNRTTFNQLLSDGFNAIMAEINRNAEKGQTTDVPDLLRTLRVRIHDHLGLDYTQAWMMDMFDVWRIGQGFTKGQA